MLKHNKNCGWNHSQDSPLTCNLALSETSDASLRQAKQGAEGLGISAPRFIRRGAQSLLVSLLYSQQASIAYRFRTNMI